MSSPPPLLTPEPPADTSGAAPPVDRSRRRRLPWALALLAIGWVVSLLAYAVGLAVILPPLILLGTASLLRGGRTLLDRIMLGLALLLGAVCVAGLLLTAWPWRLHPVPVAGVAFSVLTVLAWATGRRPRLPRPTLGDLLCVGAAVGVGAFVAIPLLRSEAPRRLGIAMFAEDVGRHTNIFNVVSETGGYLFLRWDTALEHIYSGLILYPQGWHLTAALLDNFVHSSTTAPSGMAALDRYMALVVVGMAVLTLTMAWTAQWLAGSALTLGRRIVLVGFVAAMAGVTDLFAAFIAGHHAELIGRVPLLLLLALLARPVARTRQQLLLLGSLLIAIGFTYSLFLPAASLAVLAWLVVERRRVAKHRPTALVVGLFTALLAPMPLVLGVIVSKQTDALKALGGTKPSSDALIALTLFVGAGLLAGQAWRNPIWRRYILAVAPVYLLAAGLVVGTRAAGATGDSGGYYAQKAMQLIVLVLVVGVGVVLRQLPVPDRRRRPLHRQLVGAVPAALMVVALLAALGMVRGDAPYRPVANTNYARIWYQGKRHHEAWAREILLVLNREPTHRGVPSMFLAHDAYQGYLKSMVLSTLDGTAGQVAHALYGMHAFEVGAQANAFVKGNRGTLRLIVLVPEHEALARDLAARYPDRNIIIVRRDW